MTDQVTSKVNLQDAYETHPFFKPNHSILEFVQPVLDEWINNVEAKGTPFNFDKEKLFKVLQHGAFIVIWVPIEHEIEKGFGFIFCAQNEDNTEFVDGVLRDRQTFNVRAIDFAMASQHECSHRLCILRTAWQEGFFEGKRQAKEGFLF